MSRNIIPHEVIPLFCSQLARRMLNMHSISTAFNTDVGMPDILEKALDKPQTTQEYAAAAILWYCQAFIQGGAPVDISELMELIDQDMANELRNKNLPVDATTIEAIKRDVSETFRSLPLLPAKSNLKWRMN